MGAGLRLALRLLDPRSIFALPAALDSPGGRSTSGDMVGRLMPSPLYQGIRDIFFRHTTVLYTCRGTHHNRYTHCYSRKERQ